MHCQYIYKRTGVWMCTFCAFILKDGVKYCKTIIHSTNCYIVIKYIKKLFSIDIRISNRPFGSLLRWHGILKGCQTPHFSQHVTKTVRGWFFFNNGVICMCISVFNPHQHGYKHSHIGTTWINFDPVYIFCQIKSKCVQHPHSCYLFVFLHNFHHIWT